ncbi:MAG: hypothetical protein AAGG79_04955, partial [Pseudomonadota bacterium]
SSDYQSPDAAIVEEAGTAYFIAKPFMHETLVPAVVTALSGYEPHTEDGLADDYALPIDAGRDVAPSTMLSS